MLSIHTDYSENEIKLFTSLGFSNLLTLPDVVEVYKIVVERVFIENRQGNDVEALRRGINAISKCKPYRHTDEFERLIEL